MKKKIINLVMASLIGVTPLSVFAAENKIAIQPGKAVISIVSKKNPQYDLQHKKKGREQEHREHERRKEQERRERERRENQRREQERREQEKREQERRERERHERARREEERNDARYIIHRTADTIFVAQRSTGRRHYYNGLSRAISHQQRARQLYMAGSYQEAIHHSLRARRIAISIIRNNNEKWSGSWDRREEKYRHSSPKDNDLDIKLKFIKIGDKEAVKISIDLDL